MIGDTRVFKKTWALAGAAALCAFALVGAGEFRSAKPSVPKAKDGQTDWPVYGGSPDNIHYSSLKQINTQNVAQLQKVWSYDTQEQGGLETSPLIIDGILYAYTPTQKVFALNAATGKLIWKFTSPGGEVPARAERGLAFWRDGSDKRILAGVANYVYAIDATTGKGIPSFGKDGRIDLRDNLRGDPKSQSVSITSPGVIYKDLIILGDAVPEQLPAPPGDIRAYDVRTGKLRWTFHTIPHPGEFGYDTWPKNAWTYSGSANNWCGMAVDTERGIVYVPTGSAATDWYGADRVGDDLFANTLIALDAETGKRIWHFQGVRHDLWDRDFPAPPALVTVLRDGKQIPAVAQTSKQGYLFLFNRMDGAPLFPIEYRKFPASSVPGEVTAAEQPVPAKPAPFARQSLTEDMLTTRTPEAHRWALEQFRTFVSNGQFVPYQVGKQTVMFPGFDGGAEWGGPAFDPQTHIIYINANDVGLTNALVPHVPGAGIRSVYLSQCSSCHRADLGGTPPVIPSLVDIRKKLNAGQIADIILHGKERMPGFPNIKGNQLNRLSEYLLNGDAKRPADSAATSATSRGKFRTYDITGYHKFLDPEGYPANATPWGTLNAINLDTGEYIWKITLGQYPELVAKGLPDTGSENYGGPVVTAGGVLFIGATVLDKKFRAFDKATGKLLWEATLPLSANATPATYQVNGRQYVVIAAGGDRDPSTPKGGVYVAFALPQ
ncbi:MAG TPA: PQQ-binding-like beta-propeller repeat protein [Terracidiphilus sp.]|nr:PQQ-binding-like beta-propeller repeat protein [Terracidiphilus sp.]